MRYFKQIFDAVQAKLKDTDYVIITNDETVKYKQPAKYRVYDIGEGYGAYIKIYNPEVQNCGELVTTLKGGAFLLHRATTF